jgi:hypothetical protein
MATGMEAPVVELEDEVRDLVESYRSIIGSGADERDLQNLAEMVGRALLSLDRARRSGRFGSDSAWVLAGQDIAEARRFLEGLKVQGKPR